MQLGALDGNQDASGANELARRRREPVGAVQRLRLSPSFSSLVVSLDSPHTPQVSLSLLRWPPLDRLVSLTRSPSLSSSRRPRSSRPPPQLFTSARPLPLSNMSGKYSGGKTSGGKDGNKSKGSSRSGPSCSLLTSAPSSSLTSRRTSTSSRSPARSQGGPPIPRRPHRALPPQGSLRPSHRRRRSRSVSSLPPLSLPPSRGELTSSPCARSLPRRRPRVPRRRGARARRQRGARQQEDEDHAAPPPARDPQRRGARPAARALPHLARSVLLPLWIVSLVSLRLTLSPASRSQVVHVDLLVLQLVARTR